MSLNSEKEIIKLEKYLKKQGRAELVESLRKQTNTEKRASLLAQAIHMQVISDTKDRDQELKNAKNLVSEYNAPYSDQTKMCSKISRFIHLLIEDSGQE